MQTHQDVWFSVSDQFEHIFFRACNQPNPILDFVPWPIRVPGIVFPDGTQMFTAGGGNGVPSFIAGPGISVTTGVGTVTISNTATGTGPAGTNGQLQFNNNGSAFGASEALTWDSDNWQFVVDATIILPTGYATDSQLKSYDLMLTNGTSAGIDISCIGTPQIAPSFNATILDLNVTFNNVYFSGNVYTPALRTPAQSSFTWPTTGSFVEAYMWNTGIGIIDAYSYDTDLPLELDISGSPLNLTGLDATGGMTILLNSSGMDIQSFTGGNAGTTVVTIDRNGGINSPNTLTLQGTNGGVTLNDPSGSGISLQSNGMININGADARVNAATLRVNALFSIGQYGSGNSPLSILNLPTSSAGLSPGDVWNNGGVLNIV